VPFSIEKWYLDTFMTDGSLLILSLGEVRLLGVPVGRLSVEWHAPDGSVRRGFASLGRLVPGAHGFTFRGGMLEANRVRWHTGPLAGELCFQPRYPPMSLREPLLRIGSRQLSWAMDIPDADVEGELRLHDRRVAVRGRGYRDHVTAGIYPTQMRGWELRWGRAVSQSHATAWLSLRTPQGAVAGTWRDGSTGPRCVPPPLCDERVIADALLEDLPVMRIGPVRRLLSSLAGHPLQRRFIATATLDGEPARAVHEIVQWG
jgi:hypothetical protein